VIRCFALVLCCCLAADAADPPLPVLRTAEVLEVHGRLDGQPFWARLLAPDATFNHHRVLQLVYAPPAPEAVAGARLADCPFVLIDGNARVVAWNGRDSLSQVVPAAPSGYSVVRELSTGEGDAASLSSDKRTIRGERGWDLHLAPLLLALTWTAGATGEVAVVDLFGAREKDALRASWNGEKVTIGGDGYTAAADGQGRLARLVDALGMARIEVDGWNAVK
jgi:hypothetical protein